MTEPADVQATRRAYDTVAPDYAELLRDELDSKPFDRAILAAFADLVRAIGGGPVADVGCGPGRITAHLHALGVDVFGVDLSDAMIAEARRAHPHLRFAQGSMAELDLDDQGLAGVVAWYAIIHTPPDRQPQVFRELHRVLRPGGQILLAFQIGDERVRLEHAYGHDLSLDAYRLPPDRIIDQLRDTGFVLVARMTREPSGREKQPQAYLFLERPARDLGGPTVRV